MKFAVALCSGRLMLTEYATISCCVLLDPLSLSTLYAWLFYFHAKLNFAAATQKLLAQVDTRSGVQSFS
jgi:hypothetical protein